MTEKRKSGGKAKVANAVRAATPAAVSASPDYLSKRFFCNEQGLWKKCDGDADKMWICSAFEIKAETRDIDGLNWGLQLSWRDRDNKLHEQCFTRAQLSGDCAEVRAGLSSGGLTLNGQPPARQSFAEYMNLACSDVRAVSVPQIGWHKVGGGDVFVLPDKVYGETKERVVLQIADPQPSVFNTCNALMGWISNVSSLCIGNSRMVFACSTALAPPLLAILGEQGGGFNFCGASQIGKSTVLRVAASVWGGTTSRGAAGYVRPFRATGNGLEAVACMHSDTLLCLDEMGQVDSREAGEIAYLLGNGQVKLRANRAGGSLRATMQFRLLFLSTGEIGLGEKNREAGKETKAGQEVRHTDIPADAGAGMGLFEDLHGEPSPSAFASAIREGTDNYYGSAAAEFLDRLTLARNGDTDLPIKLRERCNALVSVWLAPCGEVSGQVRSISFRFALAAVAGELATEWGITGWIAGEASKGVHECLKACLVERGTYGAREDEQAFIKLRDFIMRHGESRFAIMPEPRARHDAEQADNDCPPSERFRTQNRVGWRRWVRKPGGGGYWVYYLTPDGMAEALQGLNKRDALAALVKRNCLVPDREGKSSRLFSLFGHEKKIRLYEVTQFALSGCEDLAPDPHGDGEGWPPQADATE